MDAYFVEQRKGAEGRDGWVSSSLVTCLKDKHQKVTRREAKKNILCAVKSGLMQI